MSRRFLSRRFVVAAAFSAPLLGAQCVAQPRTAAARPFLSGFNLAGLEFAPGRLPGRANIDYVAPDGAEIGYYRGLGAKVIRLPFLWERLQPQLGEPFDEDYFRLLARAVDQSDGMNVILDAHQFGRRTRNGESFIIGETAVSEEHFAAFWRELALRFKTNERLIFGLLNEPHDQRTDVLLRVQNAAIDAIRATGAEQLILVSGNAWSGAHSWASSGNAVAMMDIRDPSDNFAFDVHQYLDARSAGASAECALGSGQRLNALTLWCRANRRRAFLGEFGSGASEMCLAELDALLEHVHANTDVWIGWTYWAGGAWWPDTYPLAIRPRSLRHPIDRPQMAILRRHL